MHSSLRAKAEAAKNMPQFTVHYHATMQFVITQGYHQNENALKMI